MDQDINISTEKIQDLLARTFQDLVDKGEAQIVTESSTTTNTTTRANNTGNTADAQQPETVEAVGTSSSSTDAGEEVSSSYSFGRSRPSSSGSLVTSDDLHPPPTTSTNTSSGTRSTGSEDTHIASSESPATTTAAAAAPPAGLSTIFDSTSEYIITGSELTSKSITLSTHSWHVMTRPTMISNARYERNNLLFSVGFVLRRAADPSPFRPLLSKLAVTLEAMEEETRFLTSAKKRPKLQTLLERVLLSLNSSEWECNLLLNPSNALHLKLYHPPKPETSPVHDHQVPILLRRDVQLQMYDWDLAINWVILHIDGVTNARQISIKAEVDLEMVRACLRVLKHHGVIALVSAFNYSNRYEFTPKATGALAGKEPKLLQEALDFVWKRGVANSATTPQQYQQQPPPQQQQSQHHTSTSPIPNAATGIMSIHGSSMVGMHNSGMLSTDSDGSTSHPTINPVVGSPFSYFGFTPSSSSYPPRGLSMSQRSASNIRFAVMAAAQQNSLERETSAAMRGKNDEFRLFKSALAELYCACSRNLSFGDLWLALTTNKESSSLILPTGAVVVPNIPPPLPIVNRYGSSGSHSRHYSSYRKGSISEEYPADTPLPQHQQQQQQQQPQPYLPSATLDSLGLSPSEFYHLESLRRYAAQGSSSTSGKSKDNNPLLMDWKDIFQRMDHRRFVTFGLIHGLITRIHCYPCFPYSFPEPSPQMMSYHNQQQQQQQQQHMAWTTATDGTTAGGMSEVNNGGAGAGTATGTVSNNTSGGGTTSISSSDILKEYQLAQSAALLMDGTRCDDELACALERPFKKLVALVETYGKHKVLLLFAE